MNHDFKDIEIKINAAKLLEQKLRIKYKKCMIGTGAMSDPYIPITENLNNIRTCLEIIEKYGFGLAIQTKSKLIELFGNFSFRTTSTKKRSFVRLLA
jgi:DNA repair photolyase